MVGLFIRGDERYRFLGGNPFSLTSGSQQWHEQHGAELARPRITYTTHVDDVYDEVQSDGNEAGSQGYVRHLEFLLPLSQSALRPVIGFSMTSSDFSSRFRLPSSEQADFKNGLTAIAIDYRMRLNRLLQIGGMLGHSSNGGKTQWNYRSEFVLRPGSNVSLLVQVSDRASWQVLDLDINNVNGNLPLEFQQRAARLSVIYSSRTFTISSTALHSLISSLPDEGRLAEAHFHPEGDIDDLSVQTVYAMTEKWQGVLAVEWRALKAAGSFVFGGARYGMLREIQYDDILIQIGSQYHLSGQWLLLMDAQWRRLRGAAYGYAESWPFISVFDSPVSSRENFIARGSAEFWKLHVGAAMPVTSNLTLGFGANYVHLIPELLLSSWESRVLVFGARGYQERTLPVRSIDLGIVSGGFQAELAGIIAEYSFVQFVPVAALRKPDDPGETTTTGPPSAVPSVASRTSGGQFHRLSIAYEF